MEVSLQFPKLNTGFNNNKLNRRFTENVLTFDVPAKSCKSVNMLADICCENFGHF